MKHFAIAAFASLLVTATIGCKSDPEPGPKRAQPNGAKIQLEPSNIRLGKDCDVDQGALDARVVSATSSALTRAGFSIASDDSSKYRALSTVDVSYCNAGSKILNGSVVLELRRGDGATIARAEASGDLSQPQAISDSATELVERLMYDDKVINAMNRSEK